MAARSKLTNGSTMHHLNVWTHRLVVLSVALVAVALAGAGPASANGGDGGNFPAGHANAACDPAAGTCNASSGRSGGASPVAPSVHASSAGSAQGPSDCPAGYTYQPVVDINGAPLLVNPGDNVASSGFAPVNQAEQFVNILCQGNVLRIVLVPLAGSPAAAPRVTGADVARQAFASFKLVAPVPKMAPPGELVVQFPTWLWVEGWKAQSATASVPGLSATVTAAPTKVVWTMGDGGSVTCFGPGTPYDPNVPVEQQSTDCSYTYHESSARQPGLAYRASVTISYGASWTATDGTGGNLGALTATAPFTARVAEIQAINTP
jgi:hypothetical protein